MKRILSLLFALVITINLFNITIVSAHTGALNDEEKTLLELVGVIDEGRELDDYLTRGEFAEMLSNARLLCPVKCGGAKQLQAKNVERKGTAAAKQNVYRKQP